MSCTNFYNRSCPEPVNVVLNQTFLVLDGEKAAILVEPHTFTCTLIGSEFYPKLKLDFMPLPGYALTVHINGLLQETPKHYTVEDDEITFLFALTDDDVQVSYACQPELVAP